VLLTHRCFESIFSPYLCSNRKNSLCPHSVSFSIFLTLWSFCDRLKKMEAPPSSFKKFKDSLCCHYFKKNNQSCVQEVLLTKSERGSGCSSIALCDWLESFFVISSLDQKYPALSTRPRAPLDTDLLPFQTFCVTLTHRLYLFGTTSSWCISAHLQYL